MATPGDAAAALLSVGAAVSPQRRSSRCQARCQADSRAARHAEDSLHASPFAAAAAVAAGPADAGDSESASARHRRRRSASSSKVWTWHCPHRDCSHLTACSRCATHLLLRVRAVAHECCQSSRIGWTAARRTSKTTRSAGTRCGNVAADAHACSSLLPQGDTR